MPLFKCDCGVIENTAVGKYWHRKSKGEQPLCSQCAGGEWHGRFPRQTPEELGMIEGEDGFYYKPAELAPGGSLAHVTRPKVAAVS
jgi:hypothetical protein